MKRQQDISQTGFVLSFKIFVRWNVLSATNSSSFMWILWKTLSMKLEWLYYFTIIDECIEDVFENFIDNS